MIGGQSKRDPEMIALTGLDPAGRRLIADKGCGGPDSRASPTTGESSLSARRSSQQLTGPDRTFHRAALRPITGSVNPTLKGNSTSVATATAPHPAARGPGAAP